MALNQNVSFEHNSFSEMNFLIKIMAWIQGYNFHLHKTKETFLPPSQQKTCCQHLAEPGSFSSARLIVVPSIKYSPPGWGRSELFPSGELFAIKMTTTTTDATITTTTNNSGHSWKQNHLLITNIPAKTGWLEHLMKNTKRLVTEVTNAFVCMWRMDKTWTSWEKSNGSKVVSKKIAKDVSDGQKKN